MKNFGTEEEKRVITDFISGKEITNKDEVEYLQKCADITTLPFENLEASMKVNKVSEPIFFVPMNRFVPISNVLQSAREPYTDAVFGLCKDFNMFARNDLAIMTSSRAIIGRAADLIATNCYTILNNGTLLLLNAFYKGNDNFMTEKFYGMNMDSAIRSIVIAMGSCINDSIIVRKINNENTGKVFVSSLSEAKARISLEIARYMYEYIRNILLFESVDLDAMMDYFKAESGTTIDYKEETEQIIESAKYSICVQEMLNIVTDDVLRCAEIVEINFVNMFYELTNLANDAVEGGIYTKEDVSNREFTKPTGYLVDRLKY